MKAFFVFSLLFFTKNSSHKVFAFADSENALDGNSAMTDCVANGTSGTLRDTIAHTEYSSSIIEIWPAISNAASKNVSCGSPKKKETLHIINPICRAQSSSKCRNPFTCARWAKISTPWRQTRLPLCNVFLNFPSTPFPINHVFQTCTCGQRISRQDCVLHVKVGSLPLLLVMYGVCAYYPRA